MKKKKADVVLEIKKNGDLRYVVAPNSSLLEIDQETPEKKKEKEAKAALDAIRRMPCCACLKRGPSDPHHLKTRGSGGGDDLWNLVSLDRRCHQELHVLGLNRFCDKYPLFKKVIEQKGWSFCDISGKWRHEKS